MLSRKILHRTLATLLIGGSLLVMPVTSAEIYTADGSYTMSKYETLDIAEQRAVKDAMRYAQEQAGVYIESYSRLNNFDLLEDEVVTISQKVLKFVEQPNIKKSFLEDGSIKIFVSIKVEIDDTKFEEYLKKSLESRQLLNSQLEELRRVNSEQSKVIADLKLQLANVNTPQQAEKLKAEFANEDKIFLSNQKVEEAQNLNERGSYQSALEVANMAIELNPNNAMAYYTLGSVCLRSKNYDAAIENFTKSLELNPNYSVAYNDRGETYRYLKRYEKALDDYNRAIELSPNYSFPYNNRGIIFHEWGKFDLAIEDYNRALKVNPNLASAYYNRGNVFRQIEKYDDAISDYSKAIECNANYANAYYNRGFSNILRKNYRAAVEDFTKYIELDPNDAGAYQCRGICYQALGESVKAEADFERYKQLKN